MTGLKCLLGSISGARNAIVTGLAVAVTCFPLGYCKGVSDANSRHARERPEANAKMEAKDAALKEAAGRERLVDQVVTQRKEKELLDAIETIPDAVPSDRRIALGCQRLRQAGTKPADLPLVCRPLGGDRAQAGAAGGHRDQR